MVASFWTSRKVMVQRGMSVLILRANSFEQEGQHSNDAMREVLDRDRETLDRDREIIEVDRVLARPPALDDVQVPGEVDVSGPLPTPFVARQPLVIVASCDVLRARRLAERARARGWRARAATSPGGCLRMATAAPPDLVLLDSTLPHRLEGMLRSHPVSAAARVVRLSDVDSSWPTGNCGSSTEPRDTTSDRRSVLCRLSSILSGRRARA
jgi:hypothetical protein